MKLSTLLRRALAEAFADGLFVRLRHAWPHPLRLWQALDTAHAVPVLPPRRDERIVVVGTGTAALTCLRELQRAGFTRVQIVARDDAFGGTCVNLGCMPSTFVLADPARTPAETRAALPGFIETLRNAVAEQFASLPYPLVRGTVQRVVGQTLHLDDGQVLPFDRLVLATGSRTPLPPRVTVGSRTLIDLAGFWSLPAGSGVAIYAEHNVAALALGDVALRLGLKPVLLLAGANPLAGVPSYKHFVRELVKRGVKVHEHCRLLRADDAGIGADAAGKPVPLDGVAHLLVASRPVPVMPEIDGRVPTLYDLDLTCASLPQRPDIVFVGDAGGFLTAGEADQQTRRLVQAWTRGERLDFSDFESRPTHLHAQQSLAMAGPVQWRTAGEWVEIDFRRIGWSVAHGQPGKLWYTLDRQTGRIESLHLCHAQAGELIGLGALLMEHPVWDERWQRCAVHPAAAEIFKVLADDARDRLPVPPPDDAPDETAVPVAPAPTALHLQLPDTTALHPAEGLPAWIDESRWRSAVMSRDPRAYFAACLALHEAALRHGLPDETELVWCDDRPALQGAEAVQLEWPAERARCRVVWATGSVDVDY